MVSILNSVYSPAKPIESSTPIAAEMQESTDQIYPSVPRLPNNSPNTVSPVQNNYYMFNFSIMSQKNYPLSDLDSLLSKDNITEDDLLQLPEVFLEEPITPSNQTSITHELENLYLPLTDKPTIALNVRPRKLKSTTLS